MLKSYLLSTNIPQWHPPDGCNWRDYLLSPFGWINNFPEPRVISLFFWRRIFSSIDLQRMTTLTCIRKQNPLFPRKETDMSFFVNTIIIFIKNGHISLFIKFPYKKIDLSFNCLPSLFLLTISPYALDCPHLNYVDLSRTTAALFHALGIWPHLFWNTQKYDTML